MATLLTACIVCGSEKEAGKIASALVAARLAACVNYFPCKSVFSWKGRVRHAKEWVLLAKTTARNYPGLERAAKRIHSYELPAIFAWKDGFAEKKYSSWVNCAARA
ncbi:MAG: divalent-cation tolerance protein CutA [Candidatus Micrarchaeota archaeon]